MRGVISILVALVTAHIIHEVGVRRLLGLRRHEGDDAAVIPDAVTYAGVTWLLLPVWTSGLLGVMVALAVARAGLLYRRNARRRTGRAGHPLAALALSQGSHLLAVGIAVAVTPALLTGADAWIFPWQWLARTSGISQAWIPQGLVLLSAYLVAVPGGSTVVEGLLSPFARALPGEDELSMGRVIGYLERIILVTLLLIGEYAAMAVIVAAKSLARIPSLARPDGDDGPAGSGSDAAPGSYGPPLEEGWDGPDPRGEEETGAEGPAGRGAERITTEYFLIGTLGSIAVALVAALVARWALRFL